MYRGNIMERFDNAAKHLHGRNAINSIEDLLIFCQKQGYITEYQEPFRTGKPGYSAKQFYAPYLIIFDDGTKWILFSTTSMKTDRIKGQQWDASNIKEIDKSILKCYLVYPDDVTDTARAEFVRQNEKYISHKEFSAIDQIISQEELYALIEEQATKDLSVGKMKDLQGRTYESRLAEILSAEQNIIKWKTNNITAVGLHYSTFLQVVETLKLTPQDTLSIYATADKKEIGLLPTRGNPKTDVLLKATTTSGVVTHTISCKKSSEDIVSVHQFSADACVAALNSPNQTLCELIYKFQELPTLTAFGIENGEALTRELKPHLKELSLWALGGIGGIGDPTTQWAEFILTYSSKTKTTSIHTVEEYYEKLLSANITGHFGTVFQWTYPSKQRGKNIQFKVKIL